MAEQSETHPYDRSPTRPTEATPSSDDRRASDRRASDRRASDPSTEHPTVTFGYAPGAPVAGNPVLFEAEVPDDGTDARYEWAFGDGGTATGEKASHVYDSGGERTVTLTVTDEGGATRTVRRSVTVYREVAVEVGDADGDELCPVTLRGTEGFALTEEVAAESLRFGSPTALAMGSATSPVRTDARDGDLRIWVRADETGLQSADSPGRLAGHTTGGVPIAGTADRT